MRRSLLAIAVLLLGSILFADATPRVPECRRKLVDQSYLCATTLADLRSLRMALAVYIEDQGRLPQLSSIDEARKLIEPAYIRTAATQDAWGNGFVIEVSPDGRSFSIASAGSDGTFDRATWLHPGLLSSSREDAVLGSSSDKDREWVIQE